MIVVENRNFEQWDATFFSKKIKQAHFCRWMQIRGSIWTSSIRMGVFETYCQEWVIEFAEKVNSVVHRENAEREVKIFKCKGGLSSRLRLKNPL